MKTFKLTNFNNLITMDPTVAICVIFSPFFPLFYKAPYPPNKEKPELEKLKRNLTKYH